MAVRSTQGQNRAVRSTPEGRGVSPSDIASTRRSHSVFIYSVHDASTARKKLLPRVHGAHTARLQRSHCDHSV